MLNHRKAAVIGCGFVGSSIAFSLIQRGLFSELVLIDANQDKAVGEAMDLSHGLPYIAAMDVHAGDYDDLSDCALIVVTAGANQKPGQTRLELIGQNVSILNSIIPQITARPFEGILLIVSNPVDVLTYAAFRISGYPAHRVMGSGTVLDSARLRYLLGEHLKVDSRSIPAVIVAILYAKFVASKIDIPANSEFTYEELQSKYGKLPGAVQSFAPIILPIILIALASVASFPGSPFGTGVFFKFIAFIGKPEVALLLGVFLSISLIPASEKENTLKWVTQGVTDSAGILAITCAGGSFGAILKCLPIADSVGSLTSTGIGVLIPFIIAAILKIAMGASTVAMITTAGMMAPLMATMGFTSPLAKVLVVMAIGAGSMFVSHANDSYFWVVSQFSDMKTNEAYKCQTGMTGVMGLTVIILVFILSLFV